ncbi:MAG: right-handed parallel beta-helix repeat-containing protein [Planctomycetota bacterium]
MTPRPFSLLLFVALLSATACGSTARAGENLHDLPIDIAERGLTGNTFVVSLDGDDDAVGDEANPLRTLQAAADRVEPGDTVLVRGGVYEDIDNEIPLRIKRGGTAENWVKFANFPGETPIIDTDALRGIRIEGADYVVVEGFTVRGRSDEIDPEAATAHAEAFKGDDHTQTHFFTVGIRVSSSEEDKNDFPHHIIIRGNTVHDVPGGGIATGRVDYVLIENNLVYRNAYYTPWGGSGISVWQSSNHDDRQDVYRTVIRNNISHSNNNRVKFWMLGTMSDGNGIIIDALQNTQGSILDDDQTAPYNGRILIMNNLCYNNGGRGINLYESDNIDVLHNTLYRNAQRENIEHEIEFGRTNNVSVAHNIIFAEDGINAFGGYQSSALHFDTNLIHNAKSNDGWPLGDNVIEADPMLDDDYRIAKDSPARGATTSTFDFDTRRLTPGDDSHDLGASLK